jgi:hypothetical protein
VPEHDSILALTSGLLDRADPSELEARLQYFYREQRRLRDLPEPNWAEVLRVEAELFQFQDEYCTTPEREEEYLDCLERVLGCDPRMDLKMIEEAMANPCSLEDFLKELERLGDLHSSREAK